VLLLIVPDAKTAMKGLLSFEVIKLSNRLAIFGFDRSSQVSGLSVMPCMMTISGYCVPLSYPGGV
jgi:hypothetical protein